MRRWLISLIVLGIGLFILYDLDTQAQTVGRQLNEHELQSNAVAVRARLQSALVDRLQPIEALRALMETRPAATLDDFNSFLGGLYASDTPAAPVPMSTPQPFVTRGGYERLGPVRVIYWAGPDTQVHYLYPTFTLENLVRNPPRLRDDPELVPYIDLAIERRSRVVTDPIQTPPVLNAGRAIYVIDPAFDNGRLLGFAVGVYYSDRLIRNALLGTRQDDFLVRVRGSRGQLIYGRADLPPGSDEATISVANGQWSVGVGWREVPPPVDAGTRFLLWGAGGLLIAGAIFTFNREVIQNVRLQSRLAETQALQSAAALLVQNLSTEEVLRVIADEAYGLADAEGVTVLLAKEPDGEARELEVGVGLGITSRLVGIGIPIGNSMVGRAFLSGEPQLTNNPAPGEVYQVPELDVRSLLTVPLVVKGQSIGAIALFNKRRGLFGPADVRQLTAFANQAAAAIENARLFAAEQHRRRIADRLREATAVISSDLALDIVLDRILDVLGTVVHYDSASVLAHEPTEDYITVIATRGFDTDVIGNRFPTGTATPSSRVIREVRPVAVRDVAQDWPTFYNYGAQVRSWLGVPLVVKSRVIGMITLDRHEVSPFTEEEITVATAFADHAAVAFEHARLFEESERHVRQLQALYESSLQLNLTQDLQATFDRCIEILEGVTGVNRAAVFILDETRQQASVVASRNLSRRYIDMINVQQRLSLQTGPGAAAAIRTGEPHLVPNAFREERMRTWWEAAREEGYVALAAFPLNVQGKTVGALNLYFPQETHLNPDESRLYQSFANLLALAVTNQQLLAQSRRVATLEERQRLARELHDSVTQSLFSITLTTRTVRRLLTVDPERAQWALDQLQELAQGALAEMRALIFELRPAALQQEGLINALRKHAEAVKSRHHLDVQVICQGERRLPEEHEEALYRVAQEALNNIIKHAQAGSVRIELDLESPEVSLTISDDGVGFDTDRTGGSGMGLFTMRERVLPLGGTFSVDSAPGNGTTIRVTVPAPLASPQPEPAASA